MPQVQIDLVTLLQYLGIYLALCILVPPMFRRHRPREAKGGKATASAASASGSSAASLASTAGAGEPTELVRSVETSRDALVTRLAMIESARSSIELSTFIWLDDDSGRDICSALVCAARRGVRVRLLADYYGASVAAKRGRWFRTLASLPNVTVRLYNRAGLLRFWRINYRLHDKYLVVDGSTYLLGGRNISNHSLGEYLKGADIDRDLLVRAGDAAGAANGIPGHSARQLLAYFEASFGQRCSREFSPHRPRRAVAVIAEARQRMLELHATYPELDDPAFLERGLSPAESIELLSNGTNPGNKVPAVLARLSELVERGREVLVQTPYAVLDWSMFGLRPKVPKGKREIHVLTNAPELGANIFGCGEYLLHWRGLAATGARIYEWTHGPSMHAKSVLVDDDVSVVGSYNLDLRSTYIDTELMLAVKSRGLNRAIRGRLSEMAKGCCAVEARALTRFKNSGEILRRVRSESKSRLKAFFRVNLVHAKLAVSRASGILFAPYRYLM